MEPTDARGWYRLGNQREDEGRDAEAVACFERAVAADPRHAKAWNNLGAASQRLGRAEQAERAYREALRHDPALLQPNLNLGRLHESRGEFEQAAECYRTALVHHPGNAMLAHLLAAASGQATSRAPRGYVEALFDEQAARFDAHLVGELDYRIPAVLAGLVRPQFTARVGARAMDLGCGTGLVGAALGEVEAELTGVDLSSGMLREAAKRGVYVSLLQLDVLEALRQAQPGSQAAILAADVFIYVGDLGEVFSAVWTALEPGGVFAFSVEGIPAGSYRLQPSGRYAHNLAYLRSLARDTGLVIEHEAPARIRLQGTGHATGHVLLMRKPASRV
jgi:predicted TPR repeat methyltransferase